MNGFERLKEQVKDQEDIALKQTVDYLISHDEMEHKYLAEDKNLEGMCEFINSKGTKKCRNGWTYIPNEVVFSWAIMYWSLPNEFLKIKSSTKKTEKNNNSQKEDIKDNVVPFKKADAEHEKKEEIKQLSLFGGVTK